MPSITPWTVIGPTRQTVESTLKAPLQGRRRYQKKTLTSQCQAQWLESRATYIKLPTLPSQGTKKTHRYFETISIAILLFYFILQYTLPFWLWHRRRCGRHHIGDHRYESSLVNFTGIQARIWIHLGTFDSTVEVTLHQYIYTHHCYSWQMLPVLCDTVIPLPCGHIPWHGKIFSL